MNWTSGSLLRRIRAGACAARASLFFTAPAFASLTLTPLTLGRPTFAALTLAALNCAALTFAAPANAGPPATEAAPSATSNGQLVLVVGAAGSAEYRQQFENDARQWSELAGRRDLELTRIEAQDDSAAEPDRSQQSQRDQLRAALAAADKGSPSPLWIVLIGHGTSERGVHKFNLVGPDVSSQELSEWLKDLAARRVIVIDCSSASAPFLPELSGPNRIVVTATRSGSENNYSRFGSQLAGSLLDVATDIDHDEEVSLLEAFLAAAAKTEKFYREQNRLATEHALIDDNGDKLGTGSDFFRGTRAVKAAQAGKQLDGEVAAKLILSSSDSAPKLTKSQEARRAELEAQLDQLRATMPSPPTEAYWNQLEKILLELAAVYEKVDAP